MTNVQCQSSGTSGPSILWTKETLSQDYNGLRRGGSLRTFCSLDKDLIATRKQSSVGDERERR